jgi:hypothetical protein
MLFGMFNSDKDKSDKSDIGKVYNNNYKQVVNNKFRKLANKNFVRSQYPDKSNVIPALYNTVNSPYNENMPLMPREFSQLEELHNLNPNLDPLDNNNFLSQFSPLKFDSTQEPVSQNGVNKSSADSSKNSDARISRAELERRLALQGNYSNFNDDSDATMNYSALSKAEKDITRETFMQSNKPFFKPNGSYGIDGNGEQNRGNNIQRKMELFSGNSNNLDYRPHIERAPLFNPVMGNTNIYGSPVMTDVQESRYEPSKERRNELPFQQVRITPGLGLGANEINKQGYQDMLRIIPKTIDELRVANNPQISYSAPVIQGIKGHKGQVQGKTFKYRPTTFMEYGPEWLIPGVNDVKAPRIEGHIDAGNLATINRGTSMQSYIGPAKSQVEQTIPTGLIPKSHESNKETYMNDDPRNAVYNEAHKAYGFAETYDAKETNRVMRNNYLGPTGNSSRDKNIAHNYNDIPNITNTELYINTDRAGIMRGREQDKIKAYNLNDIQDATMRSVHSNLDRAGQMGNQQMSRNKVSNFDDIQDLTLRDIHNKTDRTGQMGNQQISRNKVSNFGDIQDLTMRDIHNKTDRTGQIGNGQFNKTYAFDFVNNIQNNTMRNIHASTDRAGLMGNQQFNKNYAFDFVNNIPNMTLREMQIEQKRINPLKSSAEQTRSRLDALNMDVNIQKEIISQGRAPTLSNINQGPTFKFSQFEQRVPLQVNRELYPQSNQEAFYRHDPNITRVPTNLMVDPNRFDTFVEDNLRTNPYINNIIHKSSMAE